MRRGAIGLKSYRLLRRFHSSSRPNLGHLPTVPILQNDFHNVNIEEFRRKAFIPENPILMTGKTNEDTSTSSSIPAAVKWFSFAPNEETKGSKQVLCHQYLDHFSATILPYELNVDKNQQSPEAGTSEIQKSLAGIIASSPESAFHRFNAPLSLFLQTCKENPSPSLRLYIAQAQIIDLPKQLQEDLPTPKLVLEVGKGDIYDANIWIGIPPTYTPLHKDPNPNLFVQLASSKRVRLFKPNIGLSIFRDVQLRIGGSSPSTFRGEEMMDGPERDVLEDVVWGEHSENREGFEAVVSPGDALFIPKGWWHSIKSMGPDITASVNWWFR
jgi:hypothetical protein